MPGSKIKFDGIIIKGNDLVIDESFYNTERQKRGYTYIKNESNYSKIIKGG